MKRKFFKRLIAFLFVIAFIAAGIVAFNNIYKKRVVPLAYADLVLKYSEEYGIPQSHIFAVIKCESDFDPNAESQAGAIGLMQLMPETYDWLCKKLKIDNTENTIRDPETNIKLGTYYLKWLYGIFSDWDLVFAAYNAGQNRVKEWLNDPELCVDGKLKEIPYEETDKYVKKINIFINQYENLYPQIKER